ncbi:MAG: hypothetical protein WDN30_14050 [Pararobbsia sp.]
MTTFLANTLQRPAYSGQDAYAVAHGKYVFAAAQIGDKVRLKQLYAGTFVAEAKLIFGALGAGATVELGFENLDGSDASADDGAIIPATAAAAAGVVRMAGAPVLLLKDCYLVVTVGGAAATGQIDAVVGYEFRGE